MDFCSRSGHAHFPFHLSLALCSKYESKRDRSKEMGQERRISLMDVGILEIIESVRPSNTSGNKRTVTGCLLRVAPLFD